MATKPDIIFCANGNPRFTDIAKRSGMKTGAQLPFTIYATHQPLYFADQDFKRPRYVGYIKALKKYRPYMASVLDIEEWRRFDEYLMRAEEISQYCQVVMLIPKIDGAIRELERLFPDQKINGKEIRLGYSVPTRFGGTTVPKEEFKGWPVHLLGGSPQTQVKLYPDFETVSIDGNMAKLMANNCQFWVNGDAYYAINKYWPTLREANENDDRWPVYTGDDAPYVVFERSCQNIMAIWNREQETITNVS